MRQLDEVKAQLEKLITWRGAIEDANLSLELYELDLDEEILSEAHNGLEKLKQELDRWETERLLSGIYDKEGACLLYTSPSPRDRTRSRMPSSA